MNDRGIAIAGAGLIVAGLIILIVGGIVITLFKQLVLFFLGIAVLWAAFVIVPQFSTKGKGMKNIAVTAVIGSALIVLALVPGLPFFAFVGQAGSVGGVQYEVTNAIVSPENDFAMRVASFGTEGTRRELKFTFEGVDENFGQQLAPACLVGTTFADCSREITVPYTSFGVTGKSTVELWYCGALDEKCARTPAEWWSLCNARCNSVTGSYAVGGFTRKQEQFCTNYCQPWPNNADGRPGSPVRKEDFYEPSDPWAIVNEFDVWVDDSTCVLSEGEIVVAETFAGPKTLTEDDLSFSVKAYCSQLPILVTEQGSVVEQKLEEYQTLSESSIAIPAGQTWTLFYITDVTPDIAIDCDGVYNPQSGVCEVTPGIVYVCSDGTFDEAERVCVVAPVVRIPDEEIVCERGTYNPETRTCQYLPDTELVLGFTPDRIMVSVVLALVAVTLIAIVIKRR